MSVKAMTDPGLTDLIAAEIAMHRFIRDEGDDEFGICSCLKWRGSESFPTHVALVVKQHIARRIAELEATTRESVRVLVMERHRAEKAEAAVARAWSVIPNYSVESGGKATAEQVAWLDGAQHVERQLIAALRAD